MPKVERCDVCGHPVAAHDCPEYLETWYSECPVEGPVCYYCGEPSYDGEHPLCPACKFSEEVDDLEDRRYESWSDALALKQKEEEADDGA